MQTESCHTRSFAKSFSSLLLRQKSQNNNLTLLRKKWETCISNPKTNFGVKPDRRKHENTVKPKRQRCRTIKWWSRCCVILQANLLVFSRTKWRNLSILSIRRSCCSTTSRSMSQIGLSNWIQTRKDLSPLHNLKSTLKTMRSSTILISLSWPSTGMVTKKTN